MVDPANKGKVYPPFEYTVERAKVHEFVLAVGDSNPAYMNDDPPLPPTFPILFPFWGGLNMGDALSEIGIELQNVLHAEQEYDYLAPIHVGDTVIGQLQITDIYTKKTGSGELEFVEFVTNYRNQDRVPVLNERILIIVRG